MRAALPAALLLVAASTLLAPPASAHPVDVRCSGITGANPQDYLANLEPADPNTWFNGIVYVTLPVPLCSAMCRAYGSHCYPMPCFYTYGEEPACDGAHPIEVPLPSITAEPGEVPELPSPWE